MEEIQGLLNCLEIQAKCPRKRKKVLTDNGYIILGKGTDDLDAGAKASDDASLKDDAAFLF